MNAWGEPAPPADTSLAEIRQLVDEFMVGDDDLALQMQAAALAAVDHLPPAPAQPAYLAQLEAMLNVLPQQQPQQPQQ